MKYAALVTLIALGGCAAGSVSEIRSNAARRHEFALPANYQEVYRNIATVARNCWVGGFLLSPQAQRNVDADLFSDLGRGEVTIWMSNIGRNVYAHADIERADGGSRVTVYTYFSSWDSIGPRMEKWAKGEADCG